MDKEHFGAWLASRMPSAIVGKNNNVDCPLARFWRVDSVDLDGAHHGNCTVALVDWERRFILALGQDEVDDITAQHAIEVLRIC